jgi:tetratricopeptide (TPR) repeat protein
LKHVEALKKARLHWFSSAALVLFLAASAPAGAATPAKPLLDAQQIAYYQSGTENARVRLLIELAKNGHADMAAALLQRFPLQGPLAANRQLYIEGLILQAQGKLSASAAKYRAALANDPKLTLVRSDLAQVLARMDETEGAKHHLELLAADAQTPEQAAGIRSFIQQLDANHPLKFSGYLSFAPSTNINSGSSHQTVTSTLGGTNTSWTIDPASQQQSGIGISAGANVGYSHRLSDFFQGVLAAGIGVTYYPTLSYTSLGTSQSGELRYLLGKGYLGLGGAASQGLDPVNRNLAYSAYGPRLSAEFQVSPRDMLNLTASYQWRYYPNNSTADGNALEISGILTHALNSSSNVALIAGYENVVSQIDFNSYYDASLGFGFYRELSKGFTLEGQATGRLAAFDAVNPLAGVLRQDTTLNGSFTVTKRDWNLFGFAPSLNYSYTRNFSNISIYDYDSHAIDFRLTKAF